MTSVLAGVAAYAALGVLAAAGAAHVRGQQALRDALRRQAVFPRLTVPALAAATTSLELAAGLAGLGALGWDGGTDTRGPARAALWTATAFYLVAARYLAHLLRVRPGAPCGCGRLEHPVSRVSVLRAGVLGVMAAGAGAVVGAVVPLVPPTPEGGVVALAAVAIGIGIWALPSALYDPGTALAAPSAEAP